MYFKEAGGNSKQTLRFFFGLNIVKKTHRNVLVVGVLFVGQYGGGGEGLGQYGVHVDLGHVLDLDLTARLEDLGQVAWNGVVDRLDELEEVLNLKKNEEDYEC